jgi:hypothetical protein
MAYTYNGEIRPMICEHCDREIVHREMISTFSEKRNFFVHEKSVAKYECKVCCTINKNYLVKWDDENQWNWTKG